MIKALREGIHTLGKTVSGLDDTNFFHAEAPEQQPTPYCVFEGLPTFRSFDSGSQDERVPVQFNFMDRNAANLDTLVEAFKAVFDFGAEAAITVTGYTVTEISGTIEQPARKFGDTWRIILEYTFEISKNRS